MPNVNGDAAAADAGGAKRGDGTFLVVDCSPSDAAATDRGRTLLLPTRGAAGEAWCSVL